MTMTKMVAGISKAAVEREAVMMDASSNFIWARKLRALRAAADKAESERDKAFKAHLLLRSYAVHDDACTINRYSKKPVCSCGLNAAWYAIDHRKGAEP